MIDDVTARLWRGTHLLWKPNKEETGFTCEVMNLFISGRSSFTTQKILRCVKICISPVASPRKNRHQKSRIRFLSTSTEPRRLTATFNHFLSERLNMSSNYLHLQLKKYIISVVHVGKLFKTDVCNYFLAVYT